MTAEEFKLALVFSVRRNNNQRLERCENHSLLLRTS